MIFNLVSQGSGGGYFPSAFFTSDFFTASGSLTLSGQGKTYTGSWYGKPIANAFGWGAGSQNGMPFTAHRNEVDTVQKKYYDRVGRVDLGSLTWDTISGVSHMYYANTPADAFGVSLSSISHFSCENPIVVKASEMWSGQLDNEAIAVNDMWAGDSERIYFYTTKFSSASAVKSFMSGKYLYYEKRTPTEIDITSQIENDIVDVGNGNPITIKTHGFLVDHIDKIGIYSYTSVSSSGGETESGTVNLDVPIDYTFDLNFGRTYLYNVGDQCTDITGGWTSTGYEKPAMNMFAGTLYSDHMHLYHQWVGEKYYTITMLGTDLSIDLAPYSTLKAKINVLNSGEDGVLMGINSAKEGWRSDSLLKTKRTAGTGEQIVSIDVSNLSGPAFITLDTLCGETYPYMEADILQVWLE